MCRSAASTRRRMPTALFGIPTAATRPSPSITTSYDVPWTRNRLLNAVALVAPTTTQPRNRRLILGSPYQHPTPLARIKGVVDQVSDKRLAWRPGRDLTQCTVHPGEHAQHKNRERNDPDYEPPKAAIHGPVIATAPPNDCARKGRPPTPARSCQVAAVR